MPQPLPAHTLPAPRDAAEEKPADLLPAAPHCRIANRALWLVVWSGILCRVVQYLWDRSFWVDEASLVLNIRGKTALELLGPLDYHQAAPPLFLLAERGLVHLFGGSEFSLRMLPLLLGCAAVVLFALLARRLFSPWNAVIVVAIFAFSDRLIWHTVEVKQYGTDVFVSALLLLISMRPGEGHASPGRVLTRLSFVTALLVWFSYPAALVFGGLSLALLPACVRRGPRSAAVYFLCNALVAISFVGLLATVVHAQQTGSLGEYWAEHFLDLRHPLQWPAWFARHLLSLFDYPVQPAGVVLLVLGIVGTYGLLRAGRVRTFAMLANPITLNLLAAVAHRYPFDGERLTAYLTPMALLLAGFGTELLGSKARARTRPLAFAPAAAVALFVAGLAVFHLFVPRYRSHIRPAVQFVRSHVRAGDGVYAISYREFQCYWPADDPRVRDSLDAAAEIPFRRFWVIGAYPNEAGHKRLERIPAWARTFADQRLSFATRGGVAWLFEMRGTPPPHLPPPDISTHHKMMSREAGSE